MSILKTADASLPGTDDLHRYARLGRKRVTVGWWRLALELAPSPQSLEVGRAVRQLPDSPNVLILCHGNICRSSMAERYLRARLDERGVDGFTVRSAGFVKTDGRPSPDHAVTAAAGYEVDLSNHRSCQVTPELLDWSDLVFLMDAYNYAQLQRQYDEWTDRAVFLRAFAPGDEWEIQDPYETEIDQFDRVYAEVAEALDAFVDRVTEERQ